MTKAARALVHVALLASCLACGNRGAPIPPLPSLPNPPREVQYRQRGDVLEIRARYTVSRIRERAMRPPVRPEVLVVLASGSESAAGWLSSFRDREFVRTAKPRTLPPIEESAFGQTIVREDSLPVDALSPKGPIVLALALADARSRSLPAARATLDPARPGLTPLQGFAVEPREGGVALSWTGTDARAARVLIYRGVDGNSDSWTPWRVVPASTREVLDETAVYGQTLAYSAVAAAAPPQMGEVSVESALASGDPIAYTDVFPPRTARDIAAVAESGAIRVLWTPGGSPDESHALVLRQDGADDAPWQEVGRTDIPDSFFIDRGVMQGERYRYRILSVDERGNRGEASPEISEWITPRPLRGDEPR